MRISDGHEQTDAAVRRASWAYDAKIIYLTTADGTRWVIKEDGNGLIVRDVSMDGRDRLCVEPMSTNEVRISLCAEHGVRR